MNWLVAAPIAYLLLGVDIAFRRALAIGPPAGEFRSSPSLLFPLVVFVAMSAPNPHALWFALLAGLAVDLTTPWPLAGVPDVVRVVGPCAIAYLSAAYFVTVMRGLMIRRNPLSIVTLTTLAFALAQLIIVAIFAWRWSVLGDPIDLSPTRALASRMGSTLYTGLASIPLAFLLQRCAGVFGFHDPQSRRYSRRFA